MTLNTKLGDICVVFIEKTTDSSSSFDFLKFTILFFAYLLEKD